MVTCPHCGFDNPAGELECGRCGIIFSKTHPGGGHPTPAVHVPPPTGQPRAAVLHGETAAPPVYVITTPSRQQYWTPWKLIAVGIVGALIAHAFWLTSAPFETLKTLFHELGHAVVGWSLGYPAIPAFDFMFGGGLTHYGQFHVSIAIAVALGIGYLGYLARNNTTVVVVIGAIFVVWLIIVTKEWRRETVMASAGVIFELLLAATFLYMALAGVGWRIPEIERPLGALIAFFVQFDSWIFSMRLMRDQDFLAWYQQGKGGALMNDLEVVALNLKIYLGMNSTIQSMAKLLFVFSFVPFGVAFWLATKRGKNFTDALQAAFDFGE